MAPRPTRVPSSERKEVRALRPAPTNPTPSSSLLEDSMHT